MIKLLLLGSCVILTCILCNRLTSRIGVPMLFAFILLGMLFGSEGILHIPFDNFAFAENMCTIALIFIMFSGCRQGTSFIQCGYGSDSGSDRTVLPLRTGL